MPSAPRAAASLASAVKLAHEAMAAFQEINAQEFPGLHAYKVLVASRRGRQLYSGKYVDAQVLDAQPNFMRGSGTLYEEIVRWKKLPKYYLK